MVLLVTNIKLFPSLSDFVQVLVSSRDGQDHGSRRLQADYLEVIYFPIFLFIFNIDYSCLAFAPALLQQLSFSWKNHIS